MIACSICTHPQLADITAALMARQPYRAIEARYDVSRSAIDRHCTRHVSKAFRQLAAAEKLTDAALIVEPVLVEMRRLNSRSLRILEQAERSNDGALALGAVRECRRNLEVIARLTGELDSRAPGEAADSRLTVVVQYVDKQLVTSQETARGDLARPAVTSLPSAEGNGGSECQS